MLTALPVFPEAGRSRDLDTRWFFGHLNTIGFEGAGKLCTLGLGMSFRCRGTFGVESSRIGCRLVLIDHAMQNKRATIFRHETIRRLC
jgi:hypothetical protein